MLRQPGCSGAASVWVNLQTLHIIPCCHVQPVLEPFSQPAAEQEGGTPPARLGLAGLVTTSSPLASVSSSELTRALLRREPLEAPALEPPRFPEPPLDQDLDREAFLEAERVSTEGVVSMQMGSLGLRPVPAHALQCGLQCLQCLLCRVWGFCCWAQGM